MQTIITNLRYLNLGGFWQLGLPAERSRTLQPKREKSIVIILARKAGISKSQLRFFLANVTLLYFLLMHSGRIRIFEDIRAVFEACITQDKVRILANEMLAREWMGWVVKKL